MGDQRGAVMRVLFVVAVLFLGGCGASLPTPEKIWGKPVPKAAPEPPPVPCVADSGFATFADCVLKKSEGKEVTPAERAFLSQIRSIREDYLAGSLTDVKAHAALDMAYLNTIEKANEAERDRAAMRPRGGGGGMAPFSCHRFGNSTYCY